MCYYLQEPLSCQIYPHFSTSTALICTKLAYFMPSIYAYLHSYQICRKSTYNIVHKIFVSENCTIFFTFFFFASFYKLFWTNWSQPCLGTISFKFGTLIKHFVAYFCLNFKEMFKLNLSELWMIISLKIFKIFSHACQINHWWCGLPDTILISNWNEIDGMVSNHLR